jgi:hypothetical protein
MSGDRKRAAGLERRLATTLQLGTWVGFGIIADMTAGHIDNITPTIPLKRVGDPAEIAGLVAYLASGGSGYMTAPA